MTPTQQNSLSVTLRPVQPDDRPFQLDLYAGTRDDLNLLAWIAFIPLLYALQGEDPRQVLGYSWLQGFACYAASLYWVVITLHNFANVRIALAVLPLMLLAAVPDACADSGVTSGGMIRTTLA